MSGAPTISLEQDGCNIVVVVDTSGTGFNPQDVFYNTFYLLNGSTEQYRFNVFPAPGSSINILRFSMPRFGTDSGFTNNTTYTLRVRICGGNNCGSYSNDASITYNNDICNPPPPPAQPPAGRAPTVSLQQVGCNIVALVDTSGTGINNQQLINQQSSNYISYIYYDENQGRNVETTFPNHPTIDGSNNNILRFIMHGFGILL